MRRFFANIFFLLVILLPFAAHAAPPNNISLKLEQIGDQQESYSIGDKLLFKLTAIQKGKDCYEGVNKIKLFTKGIKIANEKVWRQITPGTWSKCFTVLVLGNKKGEVQLTAFRKTDKGNVLDTVKLKIKK